MELSNNWTLFFKALVVVIVLWISLEVAMTLIPRWIKGTKKKRKFLMVSAILKRTYKILAIIALIIILVSINYILHGGLLVVILVFGYPYINSYLSGLAFQLNPLIDTGSTINTGIISGEIIRFLPFGVVLQGKTGEMYINYKDIGKHHFEVASSQGNTARNTLDVITSTSEQRILDLLLETPLLISQQAPSLRKKEKDHHYLIT